MRTSSGDRPPTLQPHYRVYAAVVSRRTPLARVLGRGARGRTPWYLAGTCLNPPGLPPEGERPYRSTARRRGAVTADPRVGRRVPVSNQADPNPKIRRSGPTWSQASRGARTRRGPRSDPGCAVDSRAEAHARVEAEGQRFCGAEAFGSGALVHGGAEAMPWSQALGASRRPKLLRAPRESPVAGCDLVPPKRDEGALSSCPAAEAVGWLNGCRPRGAEALRERLPIAACRSRLTFGCRRGRAPRSPVACRLSACPGSRRKRTNRHGH